MRPQHITAENVRRRKEQPLPSNSFNEAAAYHCGKLITWRRWSAAAALLQ